MAAAASLLHNWLLIVLGGGFVLFSVVLTIWLLVLGP